MCDGLLWSCGELKHLVLILYPFLDSWLLPGNCAVSQTGCRLIVLAQSWLQFGLFQSLCGNWQNQTVRAASMGVQAWEPWPGLAGREGFLLPRRTTAARVGMSTPARNFRGPGPAQDCMGLVSNSDTRWQEEVITTVARRCLETLERSSLNYVNPKRVWFAGGRHTYCISCW